MKRIAINLIIIIASVLMLAGCSGKTEKTTGGVFRFSEPFPLPTQFGDPLNITGPSNYPASLSLERLIEPGEKYGAYRYVLAEKITLAKDKSYYEITLRQNVKFHDGTDCDATAIKWNLDRVKAANRAEMASVSSIQVMDKYTVRLNLSSWDANLLTGLFHDDLFMISPNAFQNNGGSAWADTHPIGTGPFIFKEIKGDQYLVWVKNPDYWQKGLPRLDGVELHSIVDPAAFTAALKAGDVLGTWDASRQTAGELAQDPAYKVYVDFPWITQGFGMNTIDPSSVWSDLRMREALANALDDKEICDTLGHGLIEPRYTAIPGIEAMGFVNANLYTYDLGKAKAMMKAAGHPQVSFKLYVSTVQWSDDSDYIVGWQKNLAKAGMNMEIVPTEPAAIDGMTQRPMPGSDIILVSLRGSTASLLDPLMESLRQGTAFGIGDARPPEWQDLLAKALAEPDTDKQLELIQQMETAADDQMLPYLPVQSRGIIAIMSRKAHDYTFGSGGANLANAWIEP
jgi:ABC-type transport system substrate-binding protein